jgi:putative serine protease PepD
LAGASARGTLADMSPTSSRRRYGLPALVVLLALAVVLVLQLLAGSSREQSRAAVPAPAAAPTGFEDVVAKALPSVVLIRSESGLGSGVVFDTAGDVVTNAHVVEGFKHFKVTLADGSEHPATLRGSFRQGDLAVVRLEGARPRPAVFADSSRVRVGQYALAIGNPLGLQSSVTQGIVSSTSRTVPEGNGVALPSVIQTSAPINPGNSGGALVDATGAVIGIPTLAATDPQMGGGAADGIGFAISSNTVRSIATQLIADGRVQHSGRAWLGVDLRTVANVGVVVAAATPSGPAARAGVGAGDLITKLAGQPVTSVDDIADALASKGPGQRIELELRGPSGPRSTTVTLGELPAG